MKLPDKMISWIVVAIFILMVLFLTKIGHFRKRAFILFLIIFIIFLYITLVIINSKNKLDFSTSQGFFNSMKIYSGWLANGFSNLKSLAANAIKLDWTSTNGTFFSNITKPSK